MKKSALRATALLLLSAAPLSAQDAWPQFRGPTQQGHSAAKGLPLTWSETERVRWKTALPGEGWSSPVVADGQVWMTTALEEGKSLRALCVDLGTGQLRHDIEVFRPASVPAKHRRNSYASPTPILAEGRVYVHFGSLGTAALDAATGRKIWENRELVIDHQNGPGGSPLLVAGKLLIACDGIDAQYEAALDAATGKVLWRSERSARAELAALPADMRKAYGTPVLATIDGRPQSITTASNRAYALDPESGREIWHVNYPRGFSNVPLPVTDGQVLVVCTGFMKPEMWGLRVGEMRGDVTETHVLWKQKAGGPDQSSPVLADGRLFMVSSGGIASCLDARTGEILWKERIGSDFAASPVLADGRLYFCDTAGVTTVIEPSATFRVLAKNQLEAGCMASPAVVGKSLLLRTKTHLYRIE